MFRSKPLLVKCLPIGLPDPGNDLSHRPDRPAGKLTAVARSHHRLTLVHQANTLACSLLILRARCIPTAYRTSVFDAFKNPPSIL